MLVTHFSGIESRYRRIFRTRLDWSWGLPSLLQNGYRVIPVGKTVDTWLLPPTPSRAEVKERE